MGRFYLGWGYPIAGLTELIVVPVAELVDLAEVLSGLLSLLSPLSTGHFPELYLNDPGLALSC